MGMEQFVRDARITMIYEAPTHSGARPVGRKLPKTGDARRPRSSASLGLSRVEQEDAALAPYLAPLKGVLGQLQQATIG